jgi:hypothetical protein
MKRIGILTSLMVWVSLGWTGTAQGDAVTDWNVIAVQTIVNAGAAHSSAVSFLDNATVQVANIRRSRGVQRKIQAVPRARDRGVGFAGGSSCGGGA